MIGLKRKVGGSCYPGEQTARSRYEGVELHVVGFEEVVVVDGVVPILKMDGRLDERDVSGLGHLAYMSSWFKIRWDERWVRGVEEKEKTRLGLVGMYKSYLDDVQHLTLGASALTAKNLLRLLRCGAGSRPLVDYGSVSCPEAVNRSNWEREIWSAAAALIVDDARHL